MMGNANIYFIRVNGETGHNDPQKPEAYIKGEPPRWPKRYFSYADLCLNDAFVRIGWPATGDLRQEGEVPARTKAYAIQPHVRGYLDEFRNIPVGSVILMPEKERPGILYIGDVTQSYFYVPEIPFECAHRLGVKWDRNGDGFMEYEARNLGIQIRGGWWLRAFCRLGHDERLATRLRAARK